MSGITQDRCCHPKCNEWQVPNGGYTVYGEPQYRKWCQQHYEELRAKNAGAKSTAEYYEIVAKKNGFDSQTEQRNSVHPYRKYRKDYCENIDGRLGFKCTSNIVWNGMLDVDHIDGSPINDNPDNYQTLCKCCHAYKTNQEKDYATPGRKTLKEAGYDVHA